MYLQAENTNDVRGEQGGARYVNLRKDKFGKPIPLYNCPLRDGHQVDYRSAAYCQNFKQKDTKLEQKEKLKKYSISVKCMKVLAEVKHRNLGDCRAPYIVVHDPHWGAAVQYWCHRRS